jgi:hypothetical protein
MRQRRSVADLLEVFTQLYDRVEGIGCLDGVRVVGDEERLCSLVGDNAFFALWYVSSLRLHFPSQNQWHTFFAFNESSVDSIVMYLSPLTLTPFAMTALVSLLSLKEAAMALISGPVSWRVSVTVGNVYTRLHSPSFPSPRGAGSAIVLCNRSEDVQRSLWMRPRQFDR